MPFSINSLDQLLSRAQPVNLSTPAAILRRWRTELVRASVMVSYSIGVLSLDCEILSRCSESSEADILQELVDKLPGILASGWVGGGWSLSPDASSSVGAAAELVNDRAEYFPALHLEIVSSDLGDLSVVHHLQMQVVKERYELDQRRLLLEKRIKEIQQVMLQKYSTGVTSVDDWLK